jgi:hypothetical protein
LAETRRNRISYFPHQPPPHPPPPTTSTTQAWTAKRMRVLARVLISKSLII